MDEPEARGPIAPAAAPAVGRVVEPVGPQDAALWCVTSPTRQLQIGAVCRFDGGPLRSAAGELLVEELRDHVASRLHLLPGFRRTVRRVPFDLARPVWVDDGQFDLDRHLRTVRVAAPGGKDDLRTVVDALFGTPLDEAHPMWELCLVDGLAGGDVGVVLRASHVLADGLSLLRAATALLDLTPDTPVLDPEPWHARAAPAAADVVRTAARVRARARWGLVTSAVSALCHPTTAARTVRSAVAGMLPPPLPAPRAPVTGRVGARRAVRWTDLPLEPLLAVAHDNGATLNDVTLAVLSGALRSVLGPGSGLGREPKVLVPVGDRAAAGGGNRFSFVVTGLPVGLDDPQSALECVHADMARRKASLQAAAVAALFSVVDVVPVPLLRRVGPVALDHQPFVNLVLTNLPGSDVPLYLRGARLTEVLPVVTGIGNVACIVGVLSYCDRLGVSLTVDPDVVTCADDLLAGLEGAARSLVATCRR